MISIKTGDKFQLVNENTRMVVDTIEEKSFFYHYIGEVVTPPNSGIMFKSRFEELILKNLIIPLP